MELEANSERVVTLGEILRGPKAAIPLQAFLWLIAIGAIIIDQATKWWIEATLEIGEAIFPFPSIGHIFEIIHVYNKGAAFGTLQGFGWLFSTVAFVVTGFILFYNSIIIERATSFRLAMGLILGGALGNVIDRIRIGQVTDFFHFNLLPLVADYPALQFRYLNWPVFNFADLFIFSGVCILITLMWRDQLPEDPWTEAEAEAEAARLASESQSVGALGGGGGGAMPITESGRQTVIPARPPVEASQASRFGVRAALILGGGLAGALLPAARVLFRPLSPRPGQANGKGRSTATIQPSEIQAQSESETESIITPAQFQSAAIQPDTDLLSRTESPLRKIEPNFAEEASIMEAIADAILIDTDSTPQAEVELDGAPAANDADGTELPHLSTQGSQTEFPTSRDTQAETPMGSGNGNDASVPPIPSTLENVENQKSGQFREWMLLIAGVGFLGLSILFIRSRQKD